MAQASRELDVHEDVVRKSVGDYAADAAQAFPGHSQMKPEELKIERLRREVAKLKAERDILKRPQPPNFVVHRMRYVFPVTRFCAEAPRTMHG